jgi:hypothetical protein
MPTIRVPHAEAEGTGLPDLTDSLDQLTKSLQKQLTAQTTAKIYRSIASDPAAPVFEGLGTAFKGLTDGMNGLATLQQTILTQTLQNLMNGTGSKTGGPQDLLAYVVVIMALKTLMADESPDKKTKADTDDRPTWRDLLDQIEKRYEAVREAENSRGPSPIDQQVHQLALQTVAQAMQPRSLADQAKELAAHVQTLREVGLVGSGTSDWREKELELEREKARLNAQRDLMAFEDRRRARQEDWPALIQQGLQGLQGLVAQLGFRPVAAGPSVVTPAAYAAAQQGA